MSNHLTYSENRSMKWLTAVFLAFSCFAFSISPVASSARQSLPTQIEQVVSSKDENDDSVSYQNVVITGYSFHLQTRSREYEKTILAHYQKEINIHFESIAEKLRSFLKTNRFQYPKMIPHNSDEDHSPFPLA